MSKRLPSRHKKKKEEVSSGIPTQEEMGSAKDVMHEFAHLFQDPIEEKAEQNSHKQHCGYAAIIGRPNVGKSTLLNRLLGQKISITSRKPQTTRHRILGIHTQDNCQIVYVDTPGIHDRGNLALHKYMNKTASQVIWDVDVIVFVVEVLRWTEADQMVLDKLKNVSVPVILAVNKVDRVKDKRLLLPYLEEMAAQYNFHSVIPIAGKQGIQIEAFEKKLQSLMPEAPFFYSPDQVTDKTDSFMAAELIREKIFRLCGEELPYSVTVEIEKYKVEERLTSIAALILVDKESHKRMIIGKRGEKLKDIGSQARQDMEKNIGHKVYLQLWVKVKTGWADDERALRSLGYDSFL